MSTLSQALTPDELATLPTHDWKLESGAAKVTIWSKANPARRATGRTLCEAYRALTGKPT